MKHQSNDEQGYRSIQDYRKRVKILKVKVSMQMKEIDDLKKQLKQVTSIKQSKFENVPLMDSGENFPQMSKDFDTQNLKNKSIVMYLYKKNAERLGLNLEGLFRYADVYSVGQIDCDEFRNMLAKMSLGLTAKQISCLIYIFDEDCNGLITKNQYLNSLRAYVISEAEQSRLYNNDCLLRIAELFAQKKIDVDGFYQEMKKSQSVVDINAFGTLIKKKFPRQLQQRQIIGAFNQIDFQSQGILEKQSFSYSLRAYLAKPRDRSRTPTKTPTRTQQFTNNSKFHNREQGNTTKIRQPQFNKTIEQFNNTNMSNSFKPIDDTQTALNLAPALQQLIDTSKQSIPEIFTRILDHKFDSQITLNVFKRILQAQNPQINNKIAYDLFKQIDKQKKGSFDIGKMFQYYAENQKDPSVLLNMIAKHLQIRETDSNRLMYINALPQDSTINRKQFMNLFTTELNVQERFLDGLWNYFNKNGSDQVTIANIIKQISIYEQQ